MLDKPGIFASAEEWGAYNAQQAAIQNAAGQAVANNYNQGTGAVQAAVAAAQQATGSSQAGVTAATAAQQANAGQVDLINQAGQNVQRAAGNVSDIAAGMAGDSATLRNRASSMWQTGQSWSGVGQDIVNLSPTASGLAGQFVSYYNSLSPESLVSFAASDAQRSIENTRGQLARQLAGMGVSPGSAAYGAALARARQYETALLAGVKTRARQLGIEKQGDALQQGMQMALNASGLGQQLASASAQTTQAAAGVDASRGGLEAQAGQLQRGAGDLAAQAAGVTQAGAGLVVNANQAASQANTALVQAQQNAAEYYSTQASSILGLLQSGNSVALSSLFG